MRIDEIVIELGEVSEETKGECDGNTEGLQAPFDQREKVNPTCQFGLTGCYTTGKHWTAQPIGCAVLQSL